METPSHPIRESDELIREHGYLVARGVRPLALVGHCEADPMAMLRASTRLEEAVPPGAIPWVFDREDGVADYGCAGAAWAVDLMEWVVKSGAVPEVQRHRIMGLLLGYSTSEIAKHEADASIRRFAEPTLPERAAR